MAHRWHRDPEVDQALIRLIDALCTWERNTGRGSTLLFVPDHEDEETILAVDGKPISHSPVMLIRTLDTLQMRMKIKPS